MIEPTPSKVSQISPRPTAPQQMSVNIRDIDMPFLSMVVFMIKWAIASIPAAVIMIIILLIIGAVFWGAITLLCGGLIAGLSNFQP